MLIGGPDWSHRRKLLTSPFPVQEVLAMLALSVATMLTVLGVSEVVARAVWPQNERNTCIDSAHGYRVTPNCTARTKIAESKWTTYHFNECGFRSDSTCLQKTRGTLRIAVIGSSLAMGYRVSMPDTFFTLTAQELTRRCKRTVDVQNLATLSARPSNVEQQAKRALALEPDIIVLPIWPLDFEKINLIDTPAPGVRLRQTVWQQIQVGASMSRAMLILKHFIYSNHDLYVRMSLKDEDVTGFLRRPLSGAWRQRYATFDESIGRLVDALAAAQVPLLIEAVPSRVEASLFGKDLSAAGLYPADFLTRIKAIADAHGTEFVNVVPVFERESAPQDLYFAVDGHLNEAGQVAIMRPLVDKLLQSASLSGPCKS